VLVRLHVGRWHCRNAGCERRIFAERPRKSRRIWYRATTSNSALPLFEPLAPLQLLPLFAASVAIGHRHPLHTHRMQRILVGLGEKRRIRGHLTAALPRTAPDGWPRRHQQLAIPGLLVENLVPRKDLVHPIG
jgi:hypothetical protein